MFKKIGIIAPSGCIKNFDRKACIDYFAQQGVCAVVFPSCESKFRYLAGEDNIRLQDIHSAFLDKTIDCIICARGGYGAIRLLDKIDFEVIAKNKKPFVGFSDVTALLITMYKKAGLCSFHGKMAVNGILNMNDNEFALYKNSILYPNFKSNLTGGILWGGNLSTIVSLFGFHESYYAPEEKIILFLEDINEPDYKIDRMLTQILQNRAISGKIAGVIFGNFTGANEYLHDIQMEFVSKLNVPYEENLNIGHGIYNTTVPFGFKI